MNDNACLFVWRMVYSDFDCDFRHWVCDRPFDEAVMGLTAKDNTVYTVTVSDTGVISVSLELEHL